MCGMHCSMTDIKVFFQFFHAWLMSPDSRLSQSIESKPPHFPCISFEWIVFHLKEHCIPLWSDVPKGGITLHDDKEVSDTRAKSMGGVTLGTCMGVFLNCLSKKLYNILHKSEEREWEGFLGFTLKSPKSTILEKILTLTP